MPSCGSGSRASTRRTSASNGCREKSGSSSAPPASALTVARGTVERLRRDHGLERRPCSPKRITDVRSTRSSGRCMGPAPAKREPPVPGPCGSCRKVGLSDFAIRRHMAVACGQRSLRHRHVRRTDRGTAGELQRDRGQSISTGWSRRSPTEGPAKERGLVAAIQRPRLAIRLSDPGHRAGAPRVAGPPAPLRSDRSGICVRGRAARRPESSDRRCGKTEVIGRGGGRWGPVQPCRSGRVRKRLDVRVGAAFNNRPPAPGAIGHVLARPRLPRRGTDHRLGSRGGDQPQAPSNHPALPGNVQGIGGRLMSGGEREPRDLQTLHATAATPCPEPGRSPPRSAASDNPTGRTVGDDRPGTPSLPPTAERREPPGAREPDGPIAAARGRPPADDLDSPAETGRHRLPHERMLRLGSTVPGSGSPQDHHPDARGFLGRRLPPGERLPLARKTKVLGRYPEEARHRSGRLCAEALGRQVAGHAEPHLGGGGHARYERARGPDP